jgi:hypothetical protein
MRFPWVRRAWATLRNGRRRGGEGRNSGQPWAVGIGIGVGVGVALGAATGEVRTGIAVGIAMGVAMGSVLAARRGKR